MSLSSWNVQKAVYAHLVAQADVKTELGDPVRLYDEAPPSPVFPYAVLGEASTEPLKGVDGGFEHEMRILVFSRYSGRREVKRLADVLHDALHDADFAVEGAALVNCRFSFCDVLRRSDHGGYFGTMKFRVVTQEE